MRDELLPYLSTGRKLAAVAITESTAGSNPSHITTKALTQKRGYWLLNGEKRWIGSAPWADAICIFAKIIDGDNGSNNSNTITGFVVPRGISGLQNGPEAVTLGIRSFAQGSIYLKDVPVSRSNLLGEINKGMEVAKYSMELGRVQISAMCIGVMKGCTQIMSCYAERRSIITGKLINNPVTLLKFNEINMASPAIETVLYGAVKFLDQNARLPEEVLLVCKSSASKFLWQCVDSCVQMLGARGYEEPNIACQILT